MQKQRLFGGLVAILSAVLAIVIPETGWLTPQFSQTVVYVCILVGIPGVLLIFGKLKVPFVITKSETQDAHVKEIKSKLELYLIQLKLLQDKPIMFVHYPPEIEKSRKTMLQLEMHCPGLLLSRGQQALPKMFYKQTVDQNQRSAFLTQEQKDKAIKYAQQLNQAVNRTIQTISNCLASKSYSQNLCEDCPQKKDDFKQQSTPRKAGSPPLLASKR